MKIAHAAGRIAICLTLMPLLRAQPPVPEHQSGDVIRREMTTFNPSYLTLMRPRVAALRDLQREILNREREMQDVACSHQIVTELGWLMGSTADTARIDARLDDLRNSLAHPELEGRARERDSDGSWGKCYDAWFLRLDASYDSHFSLDQGGSRIPLLDRVNSPRKLTQYLRAISVSDVSHTGIDHRREMNESLATLIRLIDRGQPSGYRWHPKLKATLLDLLKQLRDPNTAWWGERYRREGRIDFVDDMSTAFHIVRYLEGQLPELDKVARTLLEVRDLEYPIGWRENGKYLTHHAMDVVVLFEYAWPHMEEAQRRAASVEIGKMLQWCLTDAALADGSFREGSSGEDSVEENEYFGVAFLSRAGYFDAARRYWTDRTFPEAGNLKARLVTFIRQHRSSGAAGGGYYESALRELGEPAAAR